MHENEISALVREAAFDIHRGLGPGLLEKIYQRALYIELIDKGLKVEAEVEMRVKWKGRDIGVGYKADLIIEDKVIIELKSIEQLNTVHHKQLLTYLKLKDMRLGMLINFNEALIKSGMVRIVNGLEENFYD
jgi:GxxExxY protein